MGGRLRQPFTKMHKQARVRLPIAAWAVMRALKRSLADRASRNAEKPTLSRPAAILHSSIQNVGSAIVWALYGLTCIVRGTAPFKTCSKIVAKLSVKEQFALNEILVSDS